MNDQLNAANVLNMIDQAFDDVSLPDNASICVSSGLEPEQIEQSLQGKHWRDLTPWYVSTRFNNSLDFLTPEALRFYLPGFMKLLVTNYNDADLVIEELINRLTRDPAEFPYFDFDRFVKGLSGDQKEAIVRFLKYMKQELDGDYPKDIDKALASYWENAVGPN